MENKTIIIIILFICVLTSCISNDMPEGLSEREKKEYKYFQQNITEIDTADDNFVELADFNEAVKDYNVFFIGEGHAIAKNYDIQFYLLKNFVENHGIRYILYEGGFATGQLLNRYLKNGDISILDDIFEVLKGTLSYSKEQYNYYTKIYEYNKTLPESKKLTFVGVDVQHQSRTGFIYLLSIIPEQEAPPEISTILNEFLETMNKQMTFEEAKKQMQLFIEQIENRPELYREYFGDDYFNFKFTCENLLQAYDYYSTTITSEAKREGYICDNFAALYQYYDNAKYYGNWGDAHAHLVKAYNVGGKTFASFLNSEYEATNGKVLSILSVYYNSQRASYDNYKPVDVLGTYSVTAPANTRIILNSLAKSDFALFNMMSADSPFIMRKEDANEITYKYGFQYLLLIKNSSATTKFK